MLHKLKSVLLSFGILGIFRNKPYQNWHLFVKFALQFLICILLKDYENQRFPEFYSLKVFKLRNLVAYVESAISTKP